MLRLVMAGAVLVHDMEERNLAAAGGVVFSVNEHCYAALADGPDVEANGTTVAGSYVQREVLGSDEKTERGGTGCCDREKWEKAVAVAVAWLDDCTYVGGNEELRLGGSLEEKRRRRQCYCVEGSASWSWRPWGTNSLPQDIDGIPLQAGKELDQW